MANRFVVNLPFSSSSTWSALTAGAAGLTLRRLELTYQIATFTSSVQFQTFHLARLGALTGGFAIPINPLIDGNPVTAQASTLYGATAASSTDLAQWDLPDTASTFAVDLEGDMGITVRPGDSVGLQVSGSGQSVNVYFEE